MNSVRGFFTHHEKSHKTQEKLQIKENSENIDQKKENTTNKSSKNDFGMYKLEHNYGSDPDKEIIEKKRNSEL